MNDAVIVGLSRNKVSAMIMLAIAGAASPAVFEFQPMPVLSDWTGVTLPRRYRVEPKRAVKCGLPGCDKTTTHNGGYCCAEHCKMHVGKKGLR